MKRFIAAAVVILLLGAHMSNAQATSYQPPAHNYHQNNWMSGGA